jgi:hypothetical protein
VLLVNQALRLLIWLSCVYAGLHLPRAFAVLFLLSALIGLAALMSGGRSQRLALVVQPEWRLSLALCALFSIAFVAGFVGWGFWSWSADRADIINALILPTLLFWAGLQLGSWKRSFNTSLFLAYTLGSLVYVLLALAWSRTPWWNLQQVFPSAITVPWGSEGPLNVRSVEQNGFPALLLLGPAVTLFFTRAYGLARLAAVGFLVAAFLAGHAVWALNGRLGWLALVLSLLPALPRLWGWLRGVVTTRGAVGFSSAALLGGALIYGVRALISQAASPIWSQGFCDERFGLFAAMLSKLHEAPWGGKRLVVAFASCGTQIPLTFAEEGGAIAAAHNVFLDIYFAIGVVPVLLLLLFLVRPLWAVIMGFVAQLPYSDWQHALRWCWLCLLVVQWLFQPLLYSDGLLYYFTFLVIGLVAQEFRLGRFEPRMIGGSSELL